MKLKFNMGYGFENQLVFLYLYIETKAESFMNEVTDSYADDDEWGPYIDAYSYQDQDGEKVGKIKYTKL